MWNSGWLRNKEAELGSVVDEGREISLPYATDGGKGEYALGLSLLDVMYSASRDSLSGVEGGRKTGSMGEAPKSGGATAEAVLVVVRPRRGLDEDAIQRKDALGGHNEFFCCNNDNDATSTRRNAKTGLERMTVPQD